MKSQLCESDPWGRRAGQEAYRLPNAAFAAGDHALTSFQDRWPSSLRLSCVCWGAAIRSSDCSKVLPCAGLKPEPVGNVPAGFCFQSGSNNTCNPKGMLKTTVKNTITSFLTAHQVIFSTPLPALPLGFRAGLTFPERDTVPGVPGHSQGSLWHCLENDP